MERYVLHVEVQAADLEGAVSQALSLLDCSRADIEVDVITMQRRGFLGLFGAKPARVAVRLTDRALIARQLALRLLALSGFDARVELSQSSQQIDLSIQTDQVSRVIGRQGQTLEALQTLVTAMTDRQTTDRTVLMLDVDGYRQRRFGFLQNLAQKMMRQARKQISPVSSPPLPASERRILHDLFRAEPDLQSQSKPHGQQKAVIVQQRNA